MKTQENNADQLSWSDPLQFDYLNSSASVLTFTDNFILIEEQLDKDFKGSTRITRHVDTRCFKSEFSEEDLKFFYQQLSVPNIKTFSRENINTLCQKAIRNWLNRQKKKRSPLEPFLYALKLCDGIVGSISNFKRPAMDRLNGIAAALSRFWNINISEENEIVEHMMLTWDWYQPLCVLIYMYKLKGMESGFKNETIDEILRRKLLYIPEFTELVIDCLTKHTSPENDKALLTFFTLSKHKAFNVKSVFEVDDGMKQLFTDYVRSNSEVFSRLQEEFARLPKNWCDKRGSSYLSFLFESTKENDLMHCLYRYYSSPDDSKEKEDAFQKFANSWVAADTTQQWAFQEIKDQRMFELVTVRLNGVTGYAYGSAMFNLAQSEYPPAQDFVRTAFQAVGPQDTQYIALSCASNLLDGTPEIETIARLFFLQRDRLIGYEAKRQINWLIRKTSQKKALQDAIATIVSEILDRDDYWQCFLAGCREMFYGMYVQYYPDIYVDPLLFKAAGTLGSRKNFLVVSVMDVIETVMMRKDRGRYVNLLTDIFNDKKLPDVTRLRAAVLLNKVF